MQQIKHLQEFKAFKVLMELYKFLGAFLQQISPKT
jgi:hypothetical protein